MTSILHLAGYAISRRAQLRAKQSKDIVVKCKCSKCKSARRVKARAFLVVTHKMISSSKAAVICCEDLHDDHNVIGAFHQLKVAKAIKTRTNEDMTIRKQQNLAAKLTWIAITQRINFAM